MAQERVQRKDGSYVNVIADTKDELKAAVKAAKEANPVNSININRPVDEGHDLVVVHQDGSQELSDRVPEDALNFNPDVNQEFNGLKGDKGGSTSNNAGAKAAADAAADEALALRGPSTEGELQEARQKVADNK